MPARLYVVHGSHPCLTVEKAFDLKGIPYKKVELPASSQPLVMKLLFGGRTVPGVKFDDGAKVQGSRAILRALEDRVPSPPLYDGPAGAQAILDAERWGDDVLQSIPRRLLWEAFSKRRGAMYDFQEGGKGPKLPKPVVLAASYAVLPVERRLNDVDDAGVRADLAALPGLLDQVDAYIAEGVLDGEQPNAADLQIAPTIRLLYALEDVRPLIAGRPAEAFAFRWLDRPVATVPAGALPAQAEVPAATLPAA
ncbi:MAG TPA: glutathione S-transferase N-terminal domain-containing protein [Baekduia sp.]|uniref:glutathione S-transferase family protein n=1 Tax=Baekduia sp. TaxID=2600305 RepID=UPI002D79A9BE|nr:glutathione S-transferase N-terminal domain-containing protein [Baekduia sp.]HET6508279.1 glutathione S-transferase N-terminal domain-containing protein [Baekduia sp.]